MALWQDIATWIGPSPNKVSGGMSTVVGVVLHIQDGNEQGTEAWQRNPGSQVSSHFLAPKTAPYGRGKQMVDTADRAWAQAAGNLHWLSIECEGVTGQVLTPDQIEFCAEVLARAHEIYRVPIVSTDSPNTPGLGWHGMGGAAWGGHFSCPGDPIKAQRPQIIARALQIVLGNIMTDLDYGSWKKPPAVGDRPARVELDDLWGQEMTGGSPYSGTKSFRQAQLDRIEAKQDQVLTALAGLVSAVAAITLGGQPLKVGEKISLIVDSVT